MQVNAMSVSDFSALEKAGELWRHWGFEPWLWEAMTGVSRLVTFTKGSFLGEVARYYAADYIVWRHRGEVDCQLVYDTWAPADNVMLHRFVFIAGEAPRPLRKRSFLLGLKGYLELYQYTIGGEGHVKIRDLTPLIEQGWKIVQEGPWR